MCTLVVDEAADDPGSHDEEDDDPRLVSRSGGLEPRSHTTACDPPTSRVDLAWRTDISCRPRVCGPASGQNPDIEHQSKPRLARTWSLSRKRGSHRRSRPWDPVPAPPGPNKGPESDGPNKGPSPPPRGRDLRRKAHLT